MDDFLFTSAKAFFIISSIAALVVAAGFGVLLFYLIPLARDARDMVAKFSNAAADMEKDFEKLREVVEEEGAKGKVIIDMILGYVARAIHTPPVRRRKLAQGKKKSS